MKRSKVILWTVVFLFRCATVKMAAGCQWLAPRFWEQTKHQQRKTILTTGRKPCDWCTCSETDDGKLNLNLSSRLWARINKCSFYLGGKFFNSKKLHRQTEKQRSWSAVWSVESMSWTDTRVINIQNNPKWSYWTVSTLSPVHTALLDTSQTGFCHYSGLWSNSVPLIRQ